MRLTRVTITGAGDGASAYDLCALHDQFPFVEWGILLSESREGRDPRYPSRDWIDSLLSCTTEQLPLAGHLCGQWAREAMGGPFLWAIKRTNQFQRFQRLQFNGPANMETVQRCRLYRSHFTDKEFILQAKGFLPRETCESHEPAMLLDRSGGRGVELTEFPLPDPFAHCGYAGGLGPDNLEGALSQLVTLPSDAEFWVDAESKLRTDDKLDLNKVEAFLKIASQFIIS